MTEKLIAKIARRLDDQNVPYMIIGGQAVLLYGTPRLTRDIGITLGIDSNQFELVALICQKAGLNMLPEEPAVFAEQTMVLPAEDPASRIRVDFVFSFSTYEKQALSRVKKIEVAGYHVCFASCEDVIVHKIVAGRAVDHEDVKNILLKHGDTIDFEYIRKWLSEFAKLPEFKEVLSTFNNLKKML